MFGQALHFPRLIVALIGLQLFLYSHKSSGFVIRQTVDGRVKNEQDDGKDSSSAQRRKERDVIETSSTPQHHQEQYVIETSSTVHCASDPESLKEQRRGIGLMECQSKQIQQDISGGKVSTDLPPVLIELTEDQKSEVIAIYGSYFREKASLPKTERNDMSGRIARSVGNMEVCPSIPSWDDLKLVKGTDGRFIQIIQFPDDDLHQYILQEKCQYKVSQVVNRVSCTEKERLIRALVIDPTISLITEADVIVYCCSAYTTL